MQFSFTYNAEQDRVLIFFHGDAGQNIPDPVWLTRRMTILLARHLCRYIEKHTALPDEIDAEDRQSALKFIHHGEVQAQPPRWSGWSGPDDPPDGRSPDLNTAALLTRIVVKYQDSSLVLNLFENEAFLLTLRLEWHQIHAFLNALGNMSVKAGWDLDHVFDWAMTIQTAQNGNDQNNASE